MKRTWLVALVAVMIGAPALVAAQETPAPAPRARTRVRPRGFSYNFTTENHGRIGVVVNMAANADSDKIGARIAAVTPGGPADKAGLKAGDVITKFNGTALGSARAGDEDESGPGMKLVELAHALDPGDTVKVEYRRGNDAKQATLVAEEVEGGGPFAVTIPEGSFRGIMPHIEIPPMAETPRWEMGNMGMSFCFGDAWCSLQLVNLNADLGEYFGTREGVLVIRAPGDSSLPLKAGDVILTVGGRKATTPEHAMRILHSYDTGESVSIEVMRHQRKLTLNWTVPSEERHMTPGRRRPGGRGEPSVFRWKPTPSQWKVRLSLRSV